jgi:CHAD domain-containing protein
LWPASEACAPGCPGAERRLRIDGNSTIPSAPYWKRRERITLAVGKWISELKATTPLADAARHVLTVRLEVVRDYLPLALWQADNDHEYVHQLRVGTRRARVALEIFACCLPSKVCKGARKHLRNICQVAGEARDWDVFLASLTPWAREHGRKPRPVLDCLVGYVVAKREAAQFQLEEVGQNYPFAFERLLAETAAAVQKPKDLRLRMLVDLALPRLTGLLRELNEAASLDLEDYEHLHQVRILGKRLRYSMEVFADCFAPAFRAELYPAIEAMQEILGNAHDSYVAYRRLDTLSARLQALAPVEWKRHRPGLEDLLQYHESRLPQERERFQDWWARWCQSGSEATFSALLKNAGEPSGEMPPLQIALPIRTNVSQAQ